MTPLDTTAEFIVSVIFNSFWQALLFALAAWVVLRLRPKTNATTRHSVYVAALIASVLLPIATATFAIAKLPARTVVNASVGSVESMRSTHDAWINSGAIKKSRVAPISDRVASEPAAMSLPGRTRAQLSLPRAIALAIVALWFFGAILTLVRLGISLLHLERLKRDALPVDVAFRAQLPRWTAATAESRPVRLCRSGAIAIPIAVGLGDAMILVPETFLTAFDAHDIDAIVLHELAHLRRGDDWFNALGRCAAALLFFNPAVLWLVAQLDLEREVACDDWVLQQQGALPYATCLARVVETARWPHRAVTAPGAFVTRRGMSVRIERLLASDRDVRVRTGAGIAAMMLAMLSSIGVVAIIASPSIAYTIAPPVPIAAEPIVLPSAPVAALPPAAVAAVARAILVYPVHPVRPLSRPLPQPILKLERQPSMPTTPPSTRAVNAGHLPTVVISGKAVEQGTANHTETLADGGKSIAQAEVTKSQSIANSIRAVAQANVERYRAVADREKTIAVANVDGAQAVAAGRVAVAQANAVPEPATSADPKQIAAEAASTDYIDELAAVGYTGLSVDDLVQLKSLGISASLIRSWQEAGARAIPVDQLIKLRALGIDGDYIRAIRQRYGNGTSFDDIVGLKALGISSSYIDALSASGIRGLKIEQAEGLRALNVTPSFVRSLAQAGYPNLTVEQIEQCRALDIDAAFISRAAAHGYHHPSIDELTKLKVLGVL